MHRGEAMAYIRENLGLSQQDVADSAGMSRALVSRIEKTGEGSKRSIKDICEVLGVGEDELV